MGLYQTAKEPVIEEKTGAMKMETAPARHPALAIWMRPRETLRRIADHDPDYGVFALTILAGAALASLDVARRGETLDMPLAVLVVLVFIAGAVRGLATLYIEGWLLLVVGRWLGGSATGAEVRLAIAWSNLPLVFGVVGWWLLLAVLGMGSIPDSSLEILLPAVVLMPFLWSVVLLVVGLGTVQRFSLWRAVMSMAGATLLLLATFAALVLIGWAPFYMLFNGGVLTLGQE